MRLNRVRVLIAFAALLGLLLPLAAPLRAQTPLRSDTFRIFVRGKDVGSEELTVLQTPEGWILRGTGGIGPPLDTTLRFWEARYDPAWLPRELTLDLETRSGSRTIHTRIAGISAISQTGSGDQTLDYKITVHADSVLLPNQVFGAFEALAARLANAAPGAEIFAFIAPQGEVRIRARSVSDETIQVANRTIAARRWTLTAQNPGAPLDIDLWTESGHLLRVDMPAQSLSVVRDDIASVSARLVTVARPNDEQASIPANGFNLAATVSKPAEPGSGRLPAVVLVSGSSLTDRDEILSGVPTFGQLASSLADSGFLVVRYDKRGVGQSGGRLDVVTLVDFAEDARAVLRWTERRKDVDSRRVALVGYGEGAWIALQAAAQQSSVAALVMIAAGSAPGRELVLEQQQHLLDRSTMSPADRQQAIERQRQILDAVISGKGWEGVTAEARERADTPWYQSYLQFDVARVMARTRQPVLIVHGELDREVAAHHADRLAELARLRSKGRGADLVKIPGVNHLLRQAVTGETDEYTRLTDRVVSQDVLSAVGDWLLKTLPPPKSGK